MNRFKRNLFLQVLVGMGLGILVGIFWPEFAVQLKILATIFIRLIKMVVAPIIFISLILGINSYRQHGNVGGLAVRTLIYFEIMSIAATLLTFVVFALIKPGGRVPLSSLTSTSSQSISLPTSNAGGFQDFLIHLIPDNVFGTLMGENFLAIVILSTIFGLSILKIANHEKIMHFFEESNRVFFHMIGLISNLSPFAAFGAMAATVGQSGAHALTALSIFIGVLALSMVLFCILLFIVAYFYGFNAFKLLFHIKEEIMVALGTSSSESIFPQLMLKLETFGCSQKIVGFVLPTGYAFNLDGTAIYITAAVFFIQQVFHIPLTVADTLIILGTILVVSKGAAGVAGAGFITLSAVIVALPRHLIPVEGLALLLGIDRLMSDARTITNVIGNSVGTVIIAKAEKQFNERRAQLVC